MGPHPPVAGGGKTLRLGDTGAPCRWSMGCSSLSLGMGNTGAPCRCPWVFKSVPQAGEHRGSLQVVHGRALLLDNMGLLLTSLRPQFPHLESKRRVPALQATVRGSES